MTIVHSTLSALSAQQNESMAIASVVLHTIARVCGSGMWNPLFLAVFPPQFFGIVFGIAALGSVPTQYINIAMYEYINKHEDGFALMNNVFVIIFSLVVGIPFLLYLLIRYPREISQPESNSESESESESEAESS